MLDTVFNVAVHNPWKQESLLDFPSVTKFRTSDEVKCYLLKSSRFRMYGGQE